MDLTSAGTGTIELYDGHSDTGTAVMNVLTDVTGDPQWVAAEAVALTDQNAPESYDQQRTTLSTVAAGASTLGANVDSAQYPGARIWLLTRNIAIRYGGTTGSQVMINTPNSGSIFRCEIRGTAGTGTTFYPYGLNLGTGVTVSGVVSGCNIGTVGAATNFTISGIVVACSVQIPHLLVVHIQQG